MATRWDERFFASTRGQIVTLLRRASRTVDDLARALGLTNNAVRAHLAALERDGLVVQQGVRRGPGKPAYAYGLTPAADRLFPTPYGLVLAELLGLLAERLDRPMLEALLRETGRRLARGRATGGDRRARLQLAVAVLSELGGLAEVEEQDGQAVIQGYRCPVGSVAAARPEVCALAGALLSELVGAPVAERCAHGAQPRCRFIVPLAAADPAPDPAAPLGGDPPCWEHLLDEAGRLG